MIHSPAALWHKRQRFFPAVLAVAFSALLIVLQAGLLLGFFSLKSVPSRWNSCNAGERD